MKQTVNETGILSDQLSYLTIWEEKGVKNNGLVSEGYWGRHIELSNFLLIADMG